jgi:hypothetical protein
VIAQNFLIGFCAQRLELLYNFGCGHNFVERVKPCGYGRKLK